MDVREANAQYLLPAERQIPKGYKLTEVGVIPEDWELASIEDVAQITTGSKNTQDKIEDGEYPFFVRSQTVEHINSYSYDGEAVLTAGDGVGTGKVFHYIRGKFDAHQRVYRISEFSSRLNGYFFYLYFSNHFYNRIMQMTAKSSVDSVRREMIAKMLIPLPPTKAEQEAIAEALSDADALIEALEQLVAKKRQLKQCAMQELLTGKRRLPGFSGEWEVRFLGDLCEKITTGKIDANAMMDGGEYPFFTCAKEHYWINEFAFDTEALLISGNGANVGYVHYYCGKFNAYQRTYVLTGFSCDIHYVKIFMERNLQDRIRVEVNAGSTPYILMGTLTEMQVSLPVDSDEQSAIAQILSDMDAEITELETKLAKARTVKQGMMQQLLTGRIRLR